MNQIYETEIKPLLSSLLNQSQDDLLYSLSDQFTELRRTSNKLHFLDSGDSDGREKLTAEMRRRAIQTAVYALGIVERIDIKNETEETK